LYSGHVELIETNERGGGDQDEQHAEYNQPTGSVRRDQINFPPGLGRICPKKAPMSKIATVINSVITTNGSSKAIVERA
jgi:hypothetical protein